MGRGSLGACGLRYEEEETMNDQMYSYELRWIFHQMCVVVAVLFCFHREKNAWCWVYVRYYVEFDIGKKPPFPPLPEKGRGVLSKFQNKMC